MKLPITALPAQEVWFMWPRRSRVRRFVPVVLAAVLLGFLTACAARTPTGGTPPGNANLAAFGSRLSNQLVTAQLLVDRTIGEFPEFERTGRRVIEAMVAVGAANAQLRGELAAVERARGPEREAGLERAKRLVSGAFTVLLDVEPDAGLPGEALDRMELALLSVLDVLVALEVGLEEAANTTAWSEVDVSLESAVA